MLSIETLQAPPVPARLKGLCAIRLPYLILLTLLVLAGGFYVVENWRGPRVFWNRYAELEAQGEKLKLEQFRAPSVPAEQNFMMSPAWGMGLTSRESWNREFPKLLHIPSWDDERDNLGLIEWLPWEGQISALAGAAETMPCSVLPPSPNDERLVDYLGAEAMCDSLMLRARAAQREGNPKAAEESMRIMFRLHEAFLQMADLQQMALRIAKAALFGPRHETAWSREQSELIAAGLKQMDRMPDEALQMRYWRAYHLKYSVVRGGNLPALPKNSWYPQGWSGLAEAWSLDVDQYRIKQAEVWPVVLKKPDPAKAGPHIWQKLVNVNRWEAMIGAWHVDNLHIKMHVVLARMEHAFGWFRREHGRAIANPEELRSYLAGEWPVDPYTGKPHVVEADGNRWCMRWNAKGRPPGPEDVWSFPSKPIPPRSESDAEPGEE